MLTANEIVKEQMVQTTSKKIVRSPEKQKPCVPYVPYTPYVRTEGFVRAMACLSVRNKTKVIRKLCFKLPYLWFSFVLTQSTY